MRAEVERDRRRARHAAGAALRRADLRRMPAALDAGRARPQARRGGRRLRRACASELQTLASSDPEVERLRDSAEAAAGARRVRHGARAACARRPRSTAASRQALKANFVERTLSEAATRYLTGGAARADLRYDLAIADYEKAIALYARGRRRGLRADSRPTGSLLALRNAGRSLHHGRRRLRRR